MQRAMEMDIATGMKVKELWRTLPFWNAVRVWGISGFVMSVTLNRYFVEYLDRIIHHGPDSLPSSGSIVQDFMSFSTEYFVLDKRDELEHLLSIEDYFAWYARNDMPKALAVLREAMEEGKVYSYNMTYDSGGHYLETADSRLVVAGVSLIRHRDQLSCILVAGEKPPQPPDEEVIGSITRSQPAPGREWTMPDPALSVKDRYLEGLAGFGRVILLSRFDLVANKYDVRYLNRDIGPSYVYATDDPADIDAMESIAGHDVRELKENMLKDLNRYDNLFSGLASMIYLPLMFITEVNRIQETRFGTELRAKTKDELVQGAIAEFGDAARRFYCTIKCLATNVSIASTDQRVTPPKMEFESSGHWRCLMAGEVGEDKDGTPVVGRTWVERKDIWFAHSPSSFLVRRDVRTIDGPDPGFVYIMRSPAHDVDVYKIGLTRRTADMRAGELSRATGVPLPFGVLASWEVGDCAFIEMEIHRRLDGFRLSSRREFFHTSLSTIVEVIETVVSKN
jgi:hypothetical protein